MCGMILFCFACAELAESNGKPEVAEFIAQVFVFLIHSYKHALEYIHVCVYVCLSLSLSRVVSP